MTKRDALYFLMDEFGYDKEGAEVVLERLMKKHRLGFDENNVIVTLKED
jgi:hypothetical protein